MLKQSVLPFVLSLIAAARVFFQSRTDIALEVLALRQQVAVLKRKRPRPPIEPSGSAVLDAPANDLVSLARCAGDRQTRNGRGLASGRLPPVLALEIAAAWRSAEDHAGTSRVDSPLGPGEHRLGRAEDPRRIAEARLCAVRANRRALFAADCSAAATPARNGSHFFTTTARPSSPSTSSPCRPRRSECCTVSSSSSTSAAGSCTSTSRDIRRQIGSCNNCAKPLRRRLRIATPFWITIPSSTATSLPSWRPPDLKAKRTSIQAPWQNGTAERWIGSCRREILDHIIPVNEEHLRRVIREYVCYHHEDRVHDSLSKDTPNRTSDRAKANRRCQSDCAATPRRSPPSVHVATSCVDGAGDAGLPPTVRVMSGVDSDDGARRARRFSRCPAAFGGCDQPCRDCFRSVSCSTLCLGTASGLLRRPAPAKPLLCLRHRSGSGSPVPVPPEKQLLVLGAAPTRFRVPETDGQNRRNVCTSTESLSSVSSAAMPKRRSATQRTSRCSRSPPRRPGRMTPGRGNRGPSGIDASPSVNWLTSPAPSPKVRTWPSRANCAATNTSAKSLSATQRTAIPQRVWEIRVDSVLNLTATDTSEGTVDQVGAYLALHHFIAPVTDVLEQE